MLDVRLKDIRERKAMITTEERVLFVGIGGGNDDFSCLLLAQALRNCGAFWTAFDVAGVLSPFHHHTVEPTDVHGFYRNLPTSERFVVRNDGTKGIGFVGSQVAKIAAARCDVTDVDRSYSLSLQEGTVGLARTFRELATRYQRIVLVDIGGDVLYAGERDNHVLSPLFDALTLKGFVDSGVQGDLVVAGPGTDGELEPEALRESLETLGGLRCSGPISARSIERWERLYCRYIKHYRQGNTVPALLTAYNSRDKEVARVVTARAKVGDRRWDAPFTQRIDTALCRRYYMLNPAKVAAANPVAVSCGSPGEWFLKTQQHRRVGSEISMQYSKECDGLFQFATPSPLFSTEKRAEICNVALDDLEAGVCDTVLMHSEDWMLVVGPRCHQKLTWSYRQPTLVYVNRKSAA